MFPAAEVREEGRILGKNKQINFVEALFVQTLLNKDNLDLVFKVLDCNLDLDSFHFLSIWPLGSLHVQH